MSGSRRSLPTAATTARAVELGDARGAHHHDARLALGIRVVDPVIDAAPAQRLVQLARAVRGEDHHRPLVRPQGAALGDRDRKVGEEFEQERLELVVRAVDLVDQQHRIFGRAQRREHRPLDQKLVAIDVDRLVAGLADRQHLARVVPFIERGRGVDALVALQADQSPREHRGDRLGGLGLADAGRAFEQQRLAERERQIRGGREPVVGQIERGTERVLQRLRPVDPDDCSAHCHQCDPAGGVLPPPLWGRVGEGVPRSQRLASGKSPSRRASRVDLPHKGLSRTQIAP